MCIVYGCFATTGGSRRSHWRGPAAVSAKNTEQISELGGSGGMPPEKFFFSNARCCKLDHFFKIFVRPLGGGLGPPWPPPWSRLWIWGPQVASRLFHSGLEFGLSGKILTPPSCCNLVWHTNACTEGRVWTGRPKSCSLVQGPTLPQIHRHMFPSKILCFLWQWATELVVVVYTHFTIIKLLQVRSGSVGDEALASSRRNNWLEV